MKALRLLAALAAAACLAATRAGSGGNGAWQAAGFAAAGLYAGLACFAILRPSGRARALAILAGVVALALPAAPQPAVPLPAAAVAILAVGSFLAVAPSPGSDAPPLGRPSAGANAGPWIRLAFWLTAPIALAAAWSLGPDRLARLSETPVLAPVLAACLVALAALVFHWVVPRGGDA